MENKQAKYLDKQKGYATFWSGSFFLVFNIIFLVIASWIALEVWFYIQMIRNSTYHIETPILEHYLITIQQTHPFIFSEILKSINEIQNLLTFKCERYINKNIITLFFKILEITLARFYLFILSIPFFLLIFGVSVIDGLVQRDKRKFQAARESTFLFHRIKPLAKISFYLIFFIYMTMPIAILPELFLIPMAISSSLFTLLSIKSFKKYL